MCLDKWEGGNEDEDLSLNVATVVPPAGGVGELPSLDHPHESASPEPDSVPVRAAAGVSGQGPAQTRHPLLPL